MPFDLDSFNAAVDEALREGTIPFNGKYRTELDELLGLSRDEIDAITPDSHDLKIYDELITVVKIASKQNADQAALVGPLYPEDLLDDGD